MSLTIKNLRKSFGEKRIFSDFSYSFSDKGIYLLTGESGIGKTTLLRMIAGLDKDFEGEILEGGIGRVSFAFQEHRLIPQLSAIENVAFAISDRKDEAVVSKATELLKTLALEDEDFLLTPDSLSGGMKQRISLARAFIKDAPILLLDEPTKELDPANAEIVRGLIRKAAESRLVILASHNPEDLLSLGDNVINI